MLIIKSDKQMIEEEPWHRHSSPTMSGNFIVGERGCSSKRGRKPKWKHGLGKHKHQYRFAKHNNPFWFNWKRRPPVLCPNNREKVLACQLWFLLQKNMNIALLHLMQKASVRRLASQKYEKLVRVQEHACIWLHVLHCCVHLPCFSPFLCKLT